MLISTYYWHVELILYVTIWLPCCLVIIIYSRYIFHSMQFLHTATMIKHIYWNGLFFSVMIATGSFSIVLPDLNGEVSVPTGRYHFHALSWQRWHCFPSVYTVYTMRIIIFNSLRAQTFMYICDTCLFLYNVYFSLEMFYYLPIQPKIQQVIIYLQSVIEEINHILFSYKWCVGYTEILKWKRTNKNEIYQYFACNTLMSYKWICTLTTSSYIVQRGSCNCMLSKYISRCSHQRLRNFESTIHILLLYSCLIAKCSYSLLIYDLWMQPYLSMATSAS